MSNDSRQREIYEMRAKILKDKISALNEATRKGREEGIEAASRENAKNFLIMGIDVETVSKGTGLTIEEVIEIKKNMN